VDDLVAICDRIAWTFPGLSILRLTNAEGVMRIELEVTKDGTLKPATEDSRMQLREKKFRIGERVRCDIVRPRNPQFHRKFMAMLRASYAHQEGYDNFDKFRFAVLIAAGHCEDVLLPGGLIASKPKSIDFASCSETEFEGVYEKALDALFRDFLPEGWDADTMAQAQDELASFA
jgi:hypothetical protein